MPNWAHLPPELLGEISTRLAGETNLLRFRSVCSSWRSSAAFHGRRRRRRHPASPFLPNDGISDASWGFHLSKRTVFLLLPPPPLSGEPWLVKLDDRPSGRPTRLLNPLSRFPIKPLPEDFPKVIDFWRVRVFELGHEFVLNYVHFRPIGNILGDAGNLYMEKVVLKYLGSDSFVLLTIHVSGKLAMFRFGDKRWSVVRDMPSPYDDVVLFQGEFYAVDSTGRAVSVDSRLNVAMVAGSVFGGDKKFLVESSGELLMVDMYLSFVQAGSEEEDENSEQFYDVMGERTVRFKVYGLDWGDKKWVEMRSLGDRVLFLGDDCAFSASGIDLGCCRNCIFFTDTFFYTGGEEDVAFQGRDIGVYDMESGVIASLADFPVYSKLFWPAPDWVVSRESGVLPTDPAEANQVQGQLEGLAL